MTETKEHYSIRAWLIGLIASFAGLMMGVWMGVGMAPIPLLKSEGGFIYFMGIVEESVAKGDIAEAKRRLDTYYLSTVDLLLDDLYQNEFFLNESQMKEWQMVLEERIKETEE